MSAIINFRRFSSIPLALSGPYHLTFWPVHCSCEKSPSFKWLEGSSSQLSQKIPFYIHICKLVWLDAGIGSCLLFYVYAWLSKRSTLIHTLLCFGASQCARHQSDKVEFGVWGSVSTNFLSVYYRCAKRRGHGGILCIYHQCGRLLREKKALGYNGARFYVQSFHLK